MRTFADITERTRADDRIRHVARHDGLNLLVNREVFLEHLAGVSALPGGTGLSAHGLAQRVLHSICQPIAMNGLVVARRHAGFGEFLMPTRSRAALWTRPEPEP